jgi:hypothetical protein
MNAFEFAANNSHQSTALVGEFVEVENTLGDPAFCLEEVVWLEAIEATVVDDGLFDRLVDDHKLLPEETVARFHCPDLEHPSMVWGGPEYFRWYDADGRKRDCPRDYDELVELIAFRDRCTKDEAEREVSLHSAARPGDKEVWKLINSLGYSDYVNDFAQGVHGVL